MFLFTIKSRINPKAKFAQEFADAGGAFVNSYIAFKDFAGTVKLAKSYIRAGGWIPEKKTEAWKIEKRKLRSKREKQYYAEAIKYGYCLVFHMWPKDAPGANMKTPNRLQAVPLTGTSVSGDASKT